MIRYPTFVATLAKQDTDLDALAVESGVPIASIHAVMNGRVPASKSVKARLARALGVPAKRLFALPPDMEANLAALGPRRYVTDPATLRIIDRKRGVA